MYKSTLGKLGLLMSLFCIYFLAGCKKDKNEQPNNTPTYSEPIALKATYRPYEVAEIRYPNTRTAGNTIVGWLDDKQVKIAVINDSTLGVVLLPDLFKEGINPLTFTDKEKSHSVGITVEGVSLLRS